MYEERFWLGFWAIFALTVVCLVLGGMLIYNQRIRLFTQGGYEEAVLPGLGGTVWRKAGTTNKE